VKRGKHSEDDTYIVTGVKDEKGVHQKKKQNKNPNGKPYVPETQLGTPTTFKKNHKHPRGGNGGAG